MVILYYSNTVVYSAVSSTSGSASAAWSEVHKVKLSLNSCIIRVESLYDSSFNVSSSAMASSKACLAMAQARSGELRIS